MCLFYNGYILPLFDYCCTIWAETSKNNIDKLCKLQKRAARIILNAKFDAPSKPLFKDLGWLSFENRVQYHKGVMMYKCINNIAPQYLCDVFKFSSNQYSLRSTKSGCLFVPRPNTNFMKRTFQYSGTLLWNNIPSVIKDSINVDIFKRKYSEFLFIKQNTNL